MQPREQVYINVIAVDMEGNRSVETKPISLKMAWEAVTFKEDNDIFVADTQLSDPVYDADTGIITFTITGTEVPEAGDYLIVDALSDAHIIYVEEVLSAPTMSISATTGASAYGQPYQIRGRPADFREIIASGDINMSAASNDSSAGWRLKDALSGIDPTDIPYVQFSEKTDTPISCMDENLENPRIELVSPIDNPLVHIRGGIEIGCDINVEIKTNYGYIDLPPISDEEDAILDGGSIRSTGSVTTRLFGNIGYDLPLLDTASKTIREGKAIQRSIKIKVPIGHPLGRRLANLLGVNELTVNYSLTPALSYSVGASKGENVDIVTNDIMSYTFDEIIAFESEPLIGIPYNFERTTPDTSRFSPEFNTSHLFAKASTETEYEFHFDLLFGVRVNLTSFNRLGITTGINSRFIAEGATRERPHYDVLSQHFDNITPHEMRYMALRYQPSLQSNVAYNIKTHNAYQELGWWEKMMADVTIGRALSGNIADIPLSPDSFILLNTPHYELDKKQEADTYTFTAQPVENTGTLIGILPDHAQWHELTAESDFVLEPVENSDPPTATGHFTPTAARDATVAFVYLPELAGPLLAAENAFADELTPEERKEFVNTLRKFAVGEVEIQKAEVALVGCITMTRDYAETTTSETSNFNASTLVKMSDQSVWSSNDGYGDGSWIASETELRRHSTYRALPILVGYLNGTYSSFERRPDGPILDQTDNTSVTQFAAPIPGLIHSAVASGNITRYEYLMTSSRWPGYSLGPGFTLGVSRSLSGALAPDEQIYLNCSLVPPGSSINDYLLSLPFDQACSALKTCVREDLESR
ncbi:MAG: hypothetical protein R3F47_17165 [Gammaproteobacteria bacterium]